MTPQNYSTHSFIMAERNQIGIDVVLVSRFKNVRRVFKSSRTFIYYSRVKETIT